MPQPKLALNILLADPEALRRACLIRILSRCAEDAEVSLKISQWESLKSNIALRSLKEVDLAIVSKELDASGEKPYHAITKVLIFTSEAEAANDNHCAQHIVLSNANDTNDKALQKTFFQLLERAKKQRQKQRPLSPPELVIIGSSTGGPEVLSTLLSQLPALPFPLLIVQHIPKGLSAHLANGLNKKTSFPVYEADKCSALKAGEAVVAQSGIHAHILKKGADFFVESHGLEPQNGCLPAIDITLSSLKWISGTFGYIALSGMGEDGAAGLKKIYAHTHVVTQSAESCVVYSMPRAIVQKGMSDQSLTPLKIVDELKKWAELSRKMNAQNGGNS